MSKSKATKLSQKSPAEFFAENKNIAGFDNAGKSLYTTVRELVENSLDSAEGIGELPEIAVTIEEVSTSQLNDLRGISNNERVDEALYQDTETTAQRKKREAREAKHHGKLVKLTAQKGADDAAVAAAKRDFEKSEAVLASKVTKSYYRVTVKDNGAGMPHDQIPDMLGRVLSGTKYGVGQTRGKFGLGAKMALIWSKMTTGMPFEIRSTQADKTYISYYQLDIDIHKNAPNVHAVKKEPNPEAWRGTELSLTIEGAWSTYRSYILRYLRQIAVITPYAQFRFEYKAVDERNSAFLAFKRRTDAMPAPPLQVKHHPSSVDLELVKRLLQDTKATTLKQFLRQDFSCISADFAGRLIEEMQGRAQAGTKPADLTAAEATQLHHLLRSARFPDPDGSHLSPAGEYNLRLGVIKELHPDLIATHQSDARVFEGHAFIVEAAVSLGGQNVKQGINVHRFANRIPLLFEAGSDVVTRTAVKRINWQGYKINHSTDRVGAFVSIVSTKIPFKGAGKEYIGDDIEEMVAAVKHAMQQCCLQLRSKVARKQAAAEQRERKRTLSKYIPNAASALMQVLQVMAEGQAGSKKRKTLSKDKDVKDKELLEDVASGALSASVLEERLREHVESVDAEMMLEFQLAQGLKSGTPANVHLVPAGAHHEYGDVLFGNGAHIRMLE